MGTVTEFTAVETVGPDHYRSILEEPPNKLTLFGGGLIAQALRAAGTTVEPQKAPHSLHTTFVRAGRSGTPVDFRVERSKDGRAFSTRQVTAAQGDRVLVSMTASFHADEPSPEYQRPPDDGVPGPEETALLPGALRRDGFGIEIVEVRAEGQSNYLAWMRTPQPLPFDRVANAAVLAVMSDNGAPSVTAWAIGLHASGPDLEGGDGAMTTSLDHAMWFHRPVRLDDWLRVSATPLSTAGSRGVLLGSVHDRSGVHVASFVQEMLIRSSAAPRRP